MSTLQILESLQEAIALLNKTRNRLALGSDAVFQKVYHAEKHLNAEVAKLLAE